MKIVYLKNFRRGLATNSSSTHSLIYRNDGELFKDLDIFECNYYGRFTSTIAASREAKIKYVLASIMYEEPLVKIMSSFYPEMKQYYPKIKDAMKKGNPVLLEPIMKVEVTMPEEYMGDVIGDINSRRGRIEGMDDLGGGKIVRGYVPLAEMFGYSTDLRSKTQGRGNYSMFFERYEQVPKSVQEKVLSAKAK